MSNESGKSDDMDVQLILQILTVVLTSVSTIMLGMRCKCKSPCGEINLKPRSAPLTPPEVVKPAVGEKKEATPLMDAADVSHKDVVLTIRDAVENKS